MYTVLTLSILFLCMEIFIFSLQVNCVAFSSDFQIMVTGSDDQRVRVFNAKEGTLVCKLKGHTGD